MNFGLTLTLGELIDRLSYYGLRSVLILLFLAKGYSQQSAYYIYGTFIVASYAIPILGSLICDKYLGYKHSISSGYLLMIAGNLALAYDATLMTYVGITLLLWGVGFFKGNITTFLGEVIKSRQGDKRRAYLLFYIGMNIGAISGPIIFGISDAFFHTWSWGFIVSASLLFISFISYLTLLTQLKTQADAPTTDAPRQNKFLTLIALFGFLVVPALFYSKEFNDIFGILAISITLIIGFVSISRAPDSKKTALKTIAVICLAGFSYNCYNAQISGPITVFLLKEVNTSIGNFSIPVETFVSFRAALIVIISLAYTASKRILKSSRHAHPAVSIAGGLLLSGISFILLGLVARYSCHCPDKIALAWLLPSYLLLALSEFLIIPVSLDTISSIAPAEIKSTCIGFWYFLSSFAGFIISWTGRFLKPEISMTQHMQFSYSYYHLFTLYGVVGSIVTCFIYIFLKKLLSDH